MLMKMGGVAGNSVDYDSRPKITYNGKWTGFHVEFYAGKAYWEAILYTSGILTAEEAYEFDAWIVGGGANNGGDTSPFLAGRGVVAQQTGLTIANQLTVTIGAAATDWNGAGGTTQIGTLQAAGGQMNARTPGVCYRFSDPDKAGEAGADGYNIYGNTANNMWRIGQGGWLHWANSEYGTNMISGAGYGAGGSYYSGGPSYTGAHPGVAVIRISI